MPGGEEDDSLLQRDGTVQRPGAGAFLAAGIPTSAIAIIFGLVLLHPPICRSSPCLNASTATNSIHSPRACG
jgi:hypothetical protein